MRRILLSISLAIGLAIGTAACASPAEPIALEPGTVIIDVRTPSEFASGHLEGAVNIDVQAADFDARISELDPDAPVVVYCRSGNRSAQAISRMQSLGFDDLTNGGSVASAASLTGLSVVTEP